VKTLVFSVLGLIAGFFVVRYGLALVASETTIDRWEYKHIVRGSETRILNILDLFAAYFRTPTAWLFGLGFNTFSVITSGEKEPYSHNILVDALCEHGLVGLALTVAFLLLSLRSCVALVRWYSEVGPRRASSATLFALLSFDILVSMKEGNMFSIDSMLLFGLLAQALDMQARVAAEHGELMPHAGEWRGDDDGAATSTG